MLGSVLNNPNICIGIETIPAFLAVVLELVKYVMSVLILLLM